MLLTSSKISGKHRLNIALEERVNQLNIFHRTLGYSSHDIISSMFKVTKTIPSLSEHTKLEFVREIGFTHMRILEGMQTYLQLAGCVAKLCKLNMKPALFAVPLK
jgi:replication factor C subunit 2/4